MLFILNCTQNSGDLLENAHSGSTGQRFLVSACYPGGHTLRSRNGEPSGWNHYSLFLFSLRITLIFQTGTRGDSQCQQPGLSGDLSFPGVSCSTHDPCTCCRQQVGRDSGGGSSQLSPPKSLSFAAEVQAALLEQDFVKCVSSFCSSLFTKYEEAISLLGAFCQASLGHAPFPLTCLADAHLSTTLPPPPPLPQTWAILMLCQPRSDTIFLFEAEDGGGDPQ